MKISICLNSSHISMAICISSPFLSQNWYELVCLQNQSQGWYAVSLHCLSRIVIVFLLLKYCFVITVLFWRERQVEKEN